MAMSKYYDAYPICLSNHKDRWEMIYKRYNEHITLERNIVNGYQPILCVKFAKNDQENVLENLQSIKQLKPLVTSQILHYPNILL